MKVWIFQTGEPLHTDDGKIRPMRAMNLANTLVDRGHEVLIWSSDFFHQEKKHRHNKFTSTSVSENLTINLIPSPGYKKNIGFGRIWDHFILSLNLARKLKSVDIGSLPDIAFVGYPPIESAVVLLLWLKRNNVPTVIDVKDQWPTLFLDALPRRFHILGRLALSPYYFLGRLAIRNSTYICSMTQSYISWVEKFVNKSFQNRVIIAPLTSKLATMSADHISEADNWWSKIGIHNEEDKFRVIFVGSHMSVFDFRPVAEAANYFAMNNISVEFIICGDGNYSPQIKELFSGLDNVIFPGWIDASKIVALSLRSHASIAPYKNIDNYIFNIPNKVVDSLMLGLPLLSPLKGEVYDLILKYNVGLYYCSGDHLVNQILSLRNSNESRSLMSHNARKLFRDKFTYEKVYSNLSTELEKIFYAI